MSSPAAPNSIDLATVLAAVLAVPAAGAGGFAFVGIRRDSGELQAKIEEDHPEITDSAKTLSMAKRRIFLVQLFFFAIWIGAVITGALAALFASGAL